MEPQDRPGWNPPEAVGLEPTTPTVPDVVASGPRRSRIGTGIAVAAIGIGALGVVGTAYATNSTPSPATTPSAGSTPPGYAGGSGSAPGHAGSAPGGGTAGGIRPDGDGRTGGGPGRDRGGMGLGPGMGIHGSFVVPKQGGGYQTVDTQVGTVTGVSSTSITVTSTDGFTQTYTVDATTMVDAQRDGIAAVKTGDEVGVMAVGTGGTRTAVQIVDRTQLRDARQRLAPAYPPGQAAPSSTGTA
jgi:hypothetical protein